MTFTRVVPCLPQCVPYKLPAGNSADPRETLPMKHALLLLLAFLAALCLSRTSAQAPPSPPLTGKIAHITILGTKNIPADTVRAVLTLHPGDAYTPEAAAKDVAAITGMSVFNTISATAAPSPAGVNLTYTVVENPVIQTIKFTTNAADGKPSVPFSELFSQMKTRVGQVLDTNVLVKDLDVLFNHTTGYAAKQGYIIDVSSDINIDSKTGILTIPLIEYQVKSITVSGNSRIKTPDILAQMQLKVGDRFNSNAFDESLAAIYETGHFQKVDYKRTTTGNQMEIIFSVVEQAPATGVLDEKQGKVIPFLYDPITIPTPVIEVSINGKPPLPFIVDTGCTTGLLLNPWAAKKLGLQVSDSEEKADNYAYKRTSVQDIALVGLGSGGNAAFRSQPAQVTDLGVIDQIFANQHIAGIVGLGLLQMVTSRFDFAAKTLTIFTASHPPLFIPAGTTLPLKASSTGVLDVRATLARHTYADLVLDTGSSSTQIPLPSLKVLHPIATTSNGGMRINLAFICPDLRLAALDLGALQVPNVVVSVLPPQLSPALGLDILTGYRLTLDGPNGQLILEPSAHGGRYATGHSGLEVKRSGESWFVSKLTLRAPAQKAGLRVGDKVLAVGGAGVKKLTMLQIAGRLSGIVGVPVRVSVRRGAKLFAMSWVPGDEFSSPRSAMDGISMTKATGDPWVVVDVSKGCPGDLAALQVGDKITHIDGQTVADIPISSYGGEETEEQSKVLLEIERAGVAKPFTVRLSLPK